MTMHLAHPSLSTTGKKKGKKKFASAEAKHKAEILQEQWQANLKKWGVKEETRKRKIPFTTEKHLSESYKLKVPPGRETPKITSLDTGWTACTKPADKVYTGTKCKGIGTMHKSNAVPVFTEDEAKDISKMRR